MKQRDRDRLEDILKVAREIQEVSEGKTREDLDQELMFKRILERILEIIGEAANDLSDEFKQNNEDAAWEKMIGMRNKLIHAYLEVNYDIVWDTVQNNILELKKEVTEDAVEKMILKF